ncbi:MAG: hypothetical protein H6835_14270 [Planctomycetes bacterium]|nr:hypothetical protein [Planctomycetota bacterium]
MLLMLSGLAKLFWPATQETWVAPGFLVAGGIMEFGFAMALLSRRSARHAAVAVTVMAALLLALTAMHLRDPRPCGCLGTFQVPLWGRLSLLSAIGLAAVRVATTTWAREHRVPA